MEHRFDRSGYYVGQVLFDDLLLADFSLNVCNDQGPDQVTIDLARLCHQGRTLAHHFELEANGDALFLHHDPTRFTIQVARREADSYHLVYHSRNL